MSYIHDALKKAQKEKDALYLKYHGVIHAAGSKTRRFSGNTLRVAFALILLAFAAYLWLPARFARWPLRTLAALKWSGETSQQDAAQIYEKARIMHSEGRLQEAKHLYEGVLGIEPDHVNALNNLGVVHISQGNYSLAESNLARAIKLRPDYVDPYYNLACMYAIDGRISEGLAQLKKAVSLDQSAGEWARKDTDLNALRQSPGFEEIVAEVTMPHAGG